MRRAAAALFAVLAFVATVVSASAQSRIALVIGNSAYAAAPPLATSIADAGLVAETLRAAGYDVSELANVPATDTGQVMRTFLDKVAAAGPQAVAFFYFAGHGVQYGGENFLVPVDAHITGDDDVPYEAFRLNDLVGELSRLPAAARIVVLDAAHDHGFGRGTPKPVAPGLAIMDVPDGTLIAFNAAPGAVAPAAQGQNSLYTTALVTLMRQPGLDMEQIAKGARLEVNKASAGAQVPWTMSTLGVDLRLFEASAAPAPATVPPVAAPPPDAPVPLAAVRIPPRGERPFSRDFLRSLSPDEAYQVVIEEDTLAGYQWFVELFPQHPLAGQVFDIITARREAVLWRRTLAQNTRNAYWNYLKRYPDGAHAAEAQDRVEAMSAPREPPPTYVAAPEPLPPDYYDEAVGLADVVPQGFAPPPPVFDDMPPFFILPPPPRPPRPPIIIVRPPPPVIVVDTRRPPDIIVRPPRPPGPDGIRPLDGRRPNGARPPVVTPPPLRPADGRQPRPGIRIDNGGLVRRPPPGGPAPTPAPIRPVTPGPAPAPGVVHPTAPSGLVTTPSPQVAPARPATPGVVMPPSARPVAPGPSVAPPPAAATPGPRPGMPAGPAGRPTIQGVTPGAVPAQPVPGARPGLPPPPTTTPMSAQPPRPPVPPTTAPVTAQPPRPPVPPATAPVTAQPPRPPMPPATAPVTAQPPRPPVPAPTAAPPPRPTPPQAQPVRPQAQPVRPTAQPIRPTAQPVRPVAQPVRPQPVRPVAQPPRPQPPRAAPPPPRPQPQRAAPPPRPVAAPPRPQPPRAAPPPPRPAAPPPRAAPPPPRPAAPSCPAGTHNAGGRCVR